MRTSASRPGILGAFLRYFGARRGLVPFVASAGYVAAVGVGVDRALGGRPWLLGALSLACAFVAAGPSLPGNVLRDDGDGRRRIGLFALALWALALALASVDSEASSPWQDALGSLAALGAGLTAATALARARDAPGIAASLPSVPTAKQVLLATAATLFVAFGLALLGAFRWRSDPALASLASLATGDLPHDAHALAGGAALLVLAVSAWETLRSRRLVVGPGDRARTSLGLVLAASAVAVLLLVLRAGSSDRITRLSVASASVAVTYASTEGDPVTHARRSRRALALLLFGGPLVLLGGLAAQGPGRGVLALLVTGLVALVVGSTVSSLEQPLRPEEGRLLDAVVAAHAALVRADPETSIRDALAALRSFAGPSGQSPELWSMSPPRVLTIDGAGYPREREATLPDSVVEVARGEPEATVRTELLFALVVRRPDLRPLARWMDERGALSATLITRDGDVEGVIILPRGARRAPLTLEEARAVKRLADAFSFASAAQAALARSLERERLATKRADEVEACLTSLERQGLLTDERDRALTARLAQRASGGPFSPAARLAFEAIERRVRLRSHLALLAPVGADVVAYVARAHLEGPRGKTPFVVVDGAAAASHDVARWVDRAASPLALAVRGLLVLEDADRLPPDVQRIVATALAQRRMPWHSEERPNEHRFTDDGPSSLTVALTASLGKGSLLARLDPRLAAELEAAVVDPVVWPHLRERGEDLRTHVLAGLAREGMRVRGAPFGIEDAAYERLADYDFPGEDAELRSILERLAWSADGDVVRLVDVGRLGLRAAVTA